MEFNPLLSARYPAGLVEREIACLHVDDILGFLRRPLILLCWTGSCIQIDVDLAFRGDVPCFLILGEFRTVDLV